MQLLGGVTDPDPEVGGRAAAFGGPGEHGLAYRGHADPADDTVGHLGKTDPHGGRGRGRQIVIEDLAYEQFVAIGVGLLRQGGQIVLDP